MKRLAIMVLLVGGMLAAALGQAKAAPFSVPASNPAALPGSTKTVAPNGGCLNAGPINLTNCNDFTAKNFVYLQGSGLDTGTYDLYVTDPNGTTILSFGPTISVTVGTAGTFGPTSLCPNVATQCFSDSPNNGNEYEAWACIPGVLPTSGAASTGCVKTDNFKVEQASPTPRRPRIPPDQVPPRAAPIPSGQVQPRARPTRRGQVQPRARPTRRGQVRPRR
jgi:hypothetical protein